MKTMTPDEGWDWLVGQTRTAPFLQFPAAPRRTVTGTIIREGLWTKPVLVGVCLGFAAFGVLIPWLWVRVISMAPFLLAAAYLALRQLHVMLGPTGRDLSLVSGAWPWERSVTLPREKLELVRTVIAASEDGGDCHAAGRQVLRLCHRERGGTVDLLPLDDRPELPPAARAVVEFFGDGFADATRAHVDLPDGSRLDVPKTPTDSSYPGAGEVLRFPAPQHAVWSGDPPIIRTLGNVGRAVLPALACVVVLGMLVAASLSAVAGFVLIGLAIPAGLALLWGALCERRAGADLRTGVLYVEGFRRRRTHEWPLSDVAGVQLCVFHVFDSGTVMYEANAVVRTGAGRMRMGTSHDRERITRDAQRFAEFLGTPFWDHT